MSNSKYDKRVYAGYYKRYDGKLFYVVTMAKDGVTGEDMVIYTPYSIRKTDYLTISKKQFCEPVMVDGKLRARYKRQTQMRIEQDFIEVLEMDNMPSPKRKPVPRPDEEKYREFRAATNYYDYAKDLCMNYLVDLRKYKFSKGNSYFTALSKKEMEIVYEDLKFIKSCFQTVLRDYAEFFNERFIKRLSIRKYAEAHNMNRGSVENIQRKMYKKLSVLLYERDQADGKVRIKTTE